MTLTGVQMIYLGSLLFFGRSSSDRCIGAEQVRSREDAFQRKYLIQRRGNDTSHEAKTCAQAATEMHEDPSARSLSPWRLRMDRDDNRFPREISVAECLCQGCIINQRENLSYNSVEVYTSLVVLRKTRCPSNPLKYNVKKESIRVPVACTCVRPMIRDR